MEKTVKISLVMPCFNEELFVVPAIESLADDFFKENCELLVIDGNSSDGTREKVKSIIAEGLPIRLINNPGQTQAFGMNRGIEQADGEIIMRIDAHCIYPSDYIRTCFNLLEQKDADNVGGVMFPKGRGAGQKAIALALCHPIGVGDARWHLGNYKGFVDTVYLGTYRKSLIEEIGPYDTNAVPNEDAELNLRILNAGKKIYLDGAIKVEYFPRETFRRLAQQYFRYGKGRAYTTRKHRKVTSWRQVAPLLLGPGLITAVGLSFWRWEFLLADLAYPLALLVAALFSWRKKAERVSLKIRLLTALAFGIMHICWGAGFTAFFLGNKAGKAGERT